MVLQNFIQNMSVILIKTSIFHFGQKVPFEIRTVNYYGFSQNEPNEIKMSEFLEFSVKNDQFGKLPLDVLPALGVLSLNERIDTFYRTDTFRYLQMIDIIRFYTAMCSERFFLFSALETLECVGLIRN